MDSQLPLGISLLASLSRCVLASASEHPYRNIQWVAYRRSNKTSRSVSCSGGVPGLVTLANTNPAPLYVALSLCYLPTAWDCSLADSAAFLSSPFVISQGTEQKGKLH